MGTRSVDLISSADVLSAVNLSLGLTAHIFSSPWRVCQQNSPDTLAKTMIFVAGFILSDLFSSGEPVSAHDF